MTNEKQKHERTSKERILSALAPVMALGIFACISGGVFLLAKTLEGCARRGYESNHPLAYTNHYSEADSIRIGTYKGHRVELSREHNLCREIKLFYTTFTPNTRAGYIYARSSGLGGPLDEIKEENLLPNDSLREFANTEELKKAYEHVTTHGWSPNNQ